MGGEAFGASMRVIFEGKLNFRQFNHINTFEIYNIESLGGCGVAGLPPESNRWERGVSVDLSGLEWQSFVNDIIDLPVTPVIDTLL